jgi:phenylacetate-CoA ligase
MAETMLVEIINDDGEPCRPGEIGRVIATDLRNWATPLVRYEIADYAEASEPCPCGRGLPTLKRIVGRTRNLVMRPDGTRHWPYLGFVKFREVAPIIQYQFIQHDPLDIEVRLLTERPMTFDEETALRNVILAALNYPFTIRFTYLSERIAPSKAGKFEEFICWVGA